MQPGFRRFWRKVFQSEASVALMQDTFWWFFINNFEVSIRHSPPASKSSYSITLVIKCLSEKWTHALSIFVEIRNKWVQLCFFSGKNQYLKNSMVFAVPVDYKVCTQYPSLYGCTVVPLLNMFKTTHGTDNVVLYCRWS